MTVQTISWLGRNWLVYALLLGLGMPRANFAILQAEDDPKPLSTKEARAAAAYERDLKAALQAQQKLSQALQILMSQDQALRGRIMSTAASAQQQMQAADQMPELRLDRSSPRENDRERDKDKDNARPEFRVIDQSGAKAAMAAGAMRLAAMLPMLNATLWRNNAALAKVASDSEANRQQFRSLADPFGRRSAAETERAIQITNDALLADPENDNARLVLALAYVRLGRFTAAEKHLSELADSAGPWQVVAFAARGHLRAAGWLGKEATTRRQGAAELNRAIALRSRQPEPLLFRALANWRDGTWSQIEPDLKAALRLRPDHLDGLRLLACFYAVSPNADRKLDEAEAAARRACELTTDQDAACLESLAAVQARRGEWDAAIETQKKCVAVAGGDLAVRAEQRLADYQDKKPFDKEPPFTITEVAIPPLPPAEQALAEVLETMRAPPDRERTPRWYSERGRYMALCRKWGPAAVHYVRIARTSPVNDECFAYGCLLWLSGDKKAFQELCQRVSASDTSERAVRLASVTADSGLLPANVLRVATQPQIGAPNAIRDPAYVSHSITLAQYRAGLFGDARKRLEADIDGAPNLPEATFWKREGLGLHWQLLALIEAREGRFDQAKEAAMQASRLIQDDAPMAGELAGAAPLLVWLEYQVLKVELQDLLDKKP